MRISGLALRYAVEVENIRIIYFPRVSGHVARVGFLNRSEKPDSTSYCLRALR